MKTYINKYAFGFAILFTSPFFYSCDKEFGNMNDPWDNKQYNVDIPPLYNSIASTMTETGRGISSAFVYQYTQLAANYAASGFRLDNMVGESWENYYFALADYRKAIELIDAHPQASQMVHTRSMLQTLIALKTLKATCMFGDMPYSEAGKAIYGPDFYRPKYDKQQDIFIHALAELKTAIGGFSTSGNQVSLGSSETLLNNDIQKWIRFANSVRLKYALVMHEKNSATADAIIAETLTNPLLEPDEYIGIDPSLINGVIDRAGNYRGNNYVRMGSTIWNQMSSTNAVDGSGIYDLRTKIFFEPNSAGNWVPYPQNPPADVKAETRNETQANDPYAEIRLTTWKPAGEYYYAPLNLYYVTSRNFPDLIITGSEVSFLKAEVYNRGIGGQSANPATAKTAYEEGITSSVKFWYKKANESSFWVVNKPNATPEANELATMLGHPEIAYSSTNSTALAQIYKQNWISLFHQPMEAWVLTRRTGGATPSVPLAPTNEALNLNRLTYPMVEATSNFDNWKAVTNGTDNKTVKPWFMP